MNWFVKSFRIVLVGGLSLLTMNASAKRFVGFETDAYNRAFPANCVYDMVFSPASFELDCAIVAESLATIPKAKVSERLGVVLDFESTYKPLVASFSERTNGYSLVSARAFCVDNIKKVTAAHVNFLHRAYDAEVMSIFPREGAQAWFRTTMEGEMEDFELSAVPTYSDRFSYYDLVSVRIDWGMRGFDKSRTVKRAFKRMDGKSIELDFMNDIRSADVWEANKYTLVRLPMREGAYFFGLLPRENVRLGDIRRMVSSTEIDRQLITVTSVCDPAVTHGRCAIALPRISIRSRLNMLPIFGYFNVPTTGLRPIAGEASARELVQYVRFELDEGSTIATGKAEPTAVASNTAMPNESDSTIKTISFDRPFMFFIYHEPSASIPIAGQFTARSR